LGQEVLGTYIVLSCLVVIQSVYGVGLLVIGTPVLLIVGFPMPEILGILLPSSLSLSLLQLYSSRKTKISESGSWKFVIVGVLIGSALQLFLGNQNILRPIVGCILIGASLAHFFVAFKNKFESVVLNYRSAFHFLNSVVHGYANLGGALLSIYSSVAYSEKDKARKTSAYYYSLFVLFQIIALILSGYGNFLTRGLFAVPLVIIIFHFIGNRSFKRISNEAFYILFKFFLLISGLVIILNSI
jgi:uncharacterized membrane protein YfcA